MGRYVFILKYSSSQHQWFQQRTDRTLLFRNTLNAGVALGWDWEVVTKELLSCDLPLLMQMSWDHLLRHPAPAHSGGAPRNLPGDEVLILNNFLSQKEEKIKTLHQKRSRNGGYDK